MPIDTPGFNYKTADGRELNESEKALVASHLQALVTTLDHLSVKEVEALPQRGKLGAKVLRLSEK